MSDIKAHINHISTPSYIIEEHLLEKNLQLLAYIQSKADTKILLALKAYAYYPSFKLIQKYLSGVCCSGLYEAQLAYDDFKDANIHTYSPAFRDSDIEKNCQILYAYHL